MKIINIIKLAFFILALVLLSYCSDDIVSPEEPSLIDSLTTGSGSFIYNYNSTNYNKDIRVFYYIPTNKTNTTPILFVFHGTERNAEEYRNSTIEKATLLGFIVIAPEFSEANFPDGDAYNLGNVFIDGDNPSPSTLNPEQKWTFSIIEPLFDFVKTNINNSTTSYNAYGHSAGAQFLHRLIMFKPNTRINKAVISAAGWYTFPNSIVFPYGLSQSPVQNLSVPNFLSKNIYIQVGVNDDDPNAPGLRRNVFADAQGINRKERATNYFQFCQQSTTNNNFNWSFHLIANADHDQVKATNNAINLIFN
jgi:hypothetical protein